MKKMLVPGEFIIITKAISGMPYIVNIFLDSNKAILTADLGLNPVNDGTNIKVPIPPLNEERRKELVKLVKKFGEESKIAIRNIRRDANDHLKKEEKEKKLTEDLRHDAEGDVQKYTDEHIKLIDEIIKQNKKNRAVFLTPEKFTIPLNEICSTFL